MKSVFLIPAGPKNLSALFPEIEFSKVTDYYLEIINTNRIVAATTPLYKSNCCCPDGYTRIQFLNNIGNYDGQNFPKPSIIHEDASDEYKTRLSYPLKKSEGGTQRFNVSSNDTYTARLSCHEEDMPFLQELADSPKMYLEWTGIEGQPDDYIPVVKLSGKFEKLKNVDEFQYEFILEFKLSNEFFSLRN